MSGQSPPVAAGGWPELVGGGNLALFAVLCLGVWLNAADALVTATIMPSVARDIGGYAYFAWAAAGYMLGSIIAAASAGRVSERFGLRGAIAVSALTYAAGCVVSAAAPGIATFLAGRLAQGFGAGWVGGLCYVAIRLNFPERLWALIFAALSAVWGVATVLGPLVGGLFAGAGLWRWAFWAFALQAVAFAAAAPLLLKPAGRAGADARMALVQLAMLTAGVVLIALAGLAGRPWLSGLMVVAGLALLWLMLRIDAGAAVRLLPREAGDFATVAGAGYAMIFFLFAAAVAFSVYGPALLQALHGISPLTAGYVIASESVGWTISAMLVANLAPHRHSTAIRAGALAVLGGVAAVALTISTAPIAAVAGAGALIGVGFGLCWSLTNRRILASLPEAEGAIGSAAVPTVQLLGNAVGAAAAGAIANLLGLSQGFGAATARHAGGWLFVAFLPVAAIGCLLAWRHAGAHGRAEALRSGAERSGTERSGPGRSGTARSGRGDTPADSH